MLDAPLGLRLAIHALLSGGGRELDALSAEAINVFGKALGRDTAESANGDGFDFAAGDECVHEGSADAEAPCGLFDGQDEWRGVADGGVEGVHGVSAGLSSLIGLTGLGAGLGAADWRRTAR
jgi:hypothetical protein